MTGTRAATFTVGEREEFRRAFELAASRLPILFRSFWHRWEEAHSPHPEFLVYAENGAPVLCLTRLTTGDYRADGMSGPRRVTYAAERTITGALMGTGLL